jgi:hypothetical protein
MPSKAVPERKIGSRSQNNQLETIKKLPSPEILEAFLISGRMKPFEWRVFWLKCPSRGIGSRFL